LCSKALTKKDQKNLQEVYAVQKPSAPLQNTGRKQIRQVEVLLQALKEVLRWPVSPMN
jgi:hypothetical protein